MVWRGRGGLEQGEAEDTGSVLGGLLGHGLGVGFEQFGSGPEDMEEVFGKIGAAGGLDGGQIGGVGFEQEVEGPGALERRGQFGAVAPGDDAAEGQAEAEVEKRRCDLGRSVEVVEDAGGGGGRLTAEDGQEFGPGAAAVEVKGQARFPGDGDLSGEEGHLGVEGRVGNPEVQAAFPDGGDAPGEDLGELVQGVKVFRPAVPRVNAGCREDAGMGCREGEGSCPVVRGDRAGDPGLDTGGTGAVHGGIDEADEVGIMQVAVGVDEEHGGEAGRDRDQPSISLSSLMNSLMSLNWRYTEANRT